MPIDDDQNATYDDFVGGGDDYGDIYNVRNNYDGDDNNGGDVDVVIMITRLIKFTYQGYEPVG